MTAERAHHGHNDPHYVDENMRHCPHCEQDKHVRLFRNKTDYTHYGSMCNLLCKQCLENDKEVTALAKKANAMDLLATTLSKVSGRRVLSEMAPSSAVASKIVLEAMGGEEPTWTTIGEAIKEIIENKSMKADTRVKAISVLVNLVTTAEKNQGEPIPDNLSEDEQIEVLWEPAMQMILESASFRTQLLSNPEIRKALLLDAGVELVEA